MCICTPYIGQKMLMFEKHGANSSYNYGKDKTGDHLITTASPW